MSRATKSEAAVRVAPVAVMATPFVNLRKKNRQVAGAGEPTPMPQKLSDGLPSRQLVPRWQPAWDRFAAARAAWRAREHSSRFVADSRRITLITFDLCTLMWGPLQR